MKLEYIVEEAEILDDLMNYAERVYVYGTHDRDKTRSEAPRFPAET